MPVTNCIFRVGSAAALVTDVPARRADAKYELVRTLRTHHGADDAAFNAALQMEDEEGNLGVALTKDLVRIAGTALGRHITTMGPQGAAGVRDAPLAGGCCTGARTYISVEAE